MLSLCPITKSRSVVSSLWHLPILTIMLRAIGCYILALYKRFTTCNYKIINIPVIGCADVVAPSFSSVIRTGNDLVVKCNRTKETWFLTCKGNKWIGEMGNCTREYSQTLFRRLEKVAVANWALDVRSHTHVHIH